MSFTDVYIAAADDPVILVNQQAGPPEKSRDGIPTALSPLWPNPGQRGHPFFEASSLHGQQVQTDWGCTAHIVAGRQIRALFLRTYPDLAKWFEEYGSGPWAGQGLVERMRRLEDFIMTLDPIKMYALVAIEQG